MSSSCSALSTSRTLRVPTVLLRPRAFERQRVGRDRHLVRFDRLDRRLIVGEGGADLRDDAALDLDATLKQLALERLSLADAGTDEAALIDGDGRPDADPSLRHHVGGARRELPIRGAEIVDRIAPTNRGDGRQPVRAGDRDVASRGTDLRGDADEVAVVGEGDFHGLVGRSRERRQRIGRGELVGKLANDAAVILFASFEPPFGRGEAAAGQGKPRFGLGDVGAGEVSYLETVLARLQIGLEDAHLVAVNVTIDRSRITSM